VQVDARQPMRMSTPGKRKAKLMHKMGFESQAASYVR
jgi:hypothetical protein